MANLNRIHGWIVFVFLGLSFMGLLDASYLTFKHYQGGPIICPIFGGCDTVTSSEYSKIFGFPVALFGAFYYLTVFVISLVYFDTKKEKFLVYAAALTAIGFLSSLWFMYLQIFVIKAICFYCVISALTSTTLFVFGSVVLLNKRKTAV